jgi:hypothetical protein
VGKRTCEVNGCGREHAARGWCGLHYERWRKFGDPEHVPIGKGRYGISVDIGFVTCAWEPCSRLFVTRRPRRPARFCSRLCWQRWRRPDWSAPEPTGLVDNELCAWWIPPYCNRPATTQDLCQRCYNTARRANVQAPVFNRFKAGHAVTNINQDARTGDCFICGPGVAVAPGRKIQSRQYFDCSYSKQSYSRLKKTSWTAEAYDLAIVSQANRCAICGNAPSGRGKYNVLNADHCHAGADTRALLCGRCNLMLGLMDDDPLPLAKAAEYLSRFTL